jgi:hypothetical protein
VKQETTKRIWLEGDSINYQIGGTLCWTLPIGDLEVLGEYTDPNGPYVDDYFFVFVVRPKHLWNESSFYATGRDEFLQELGKVLGSEPTCGLVSSTDYRSRVMWPPEIAGIQLFDFVPVESKGIWERLKRKLMPEYEFVFTRAVADYLNT